MKLQGKTAVVTGASSGMGRAIAQKFAEEGANVIALARRKERLDELEKAASENNQVLIGKACDVTKRNDVDEAIQTAIDKFGKVDILVNCAGLMDELIMVDEITDEHWAKIMDVNLTSIMMTTRAAIQNMLQNESGVIINIASVGGVNGCRAGAAYTASKYGVVGLTKNTGFAYATKGIRCNAICPGGVDTEVLETGMKNPSQFGYERSMAGASFNPRYGEVSEIANVALFLASDDSSLVNGVALLADAGWSAY